MKTPIEQFAEKLIELTGVSREYAEAAFYTLAGWKREQRPIQSAIDYANKRPYLKREDL